MLRFAADENLKGDILDGLLRRKPELDILRVQDVGLLGAADPAILAWAAEAGRVLLTHDINTLPGFAYDRILAGHPMPGVFAIRQSLSIGEVIEDLLFLVECSHEGEWEGQVRYLPLR
jgi:hypothetical protein